MFKPSKLSSSITYVAIVDPAIDWDQILAKELDADPRLRDDASVPHERKQDLVMQRFSVRYTQRTLEDPGAWSKDLIFKSGEAPTKFVLGVIPPDEMVRIADECRLGKDDAKRQEAWWRAFLCSLRSIENLDGEQVPKRKVGDIDYVDPAWLKERFIRGLRAVAINVGMVAWAWNNMTETEAKN